MKTKTLPLCHSMNRFLFPARGLVFIPLLLTCFALSQSAQAISADEQSAREAALRWLALIDSGHYRQAFEEQPRRIKAASTGVDYFVKWMETRVPLGRARTRAFYKVVAYHNARGWPDGNYQQIIFKTSFERKAVGWEKVILTKETGRWEIGNYLFQ
jgi:hypothetical protein